MSTAATVGPTARAPSTPRGPRESPKRCTDHPEGASGRRRSGRRLAVPGDRLARTMARAPELDAAGAHGHSYRGVRAGKFAPGCCSTRSSGQPVQSTEEGSWSPSLRRAR